MCSNLSLLNRVIKDELDKQKEDFLQVVKGLVKAEVDYIIVGGAPLIFMSGLGEDRRLLDEIREITPISATTDMACTMDAFNCFGVKKVAIAIPLKDEINQNYRTIRNTKIFKYWPSRDWRSCEMWISVVFLKRRSTN